MRNPEDLLPEEREVVLSGIRWLRCNEDLADLREAFRALDERYSREPARELLPEERAVFLSGVTLLRDGDLEGLSRVLYALDKRYSEDLGIEPGPRLGLPPGVVEALR